LIVNVAQATETGVTVNEVTLSVASYETEVTWKSPLVVTSLKSALISTSTFLVVLTVALKLEKVALPVPSIVLLLIAAPSTYRVTVVLPVYELAVPVVLTAKLLKAIVFH
jgi:hypothetical protein